MTKKIDKLRQLEIIRDHYWETKDPILKDRLLWRAQTFRHLVHLLPGQTILEVGCGRGKFSEQLNYVCRNENHITAVTFQHQLPERGTIGPSVEFIKAAFLPGELKERLFDFVIIMELMDKGNCSWMLQEIMQFLKPGGQVVFYESNPGNPFLKARNFFSRLMGKPKHRRLLKRKRLHEHVTERGFTNIISIYNDFVYAPLTPRGVWLLRNLSILLENLVFVKTLAGSILIHAQKPPDNLPLERVSLCKHVKLHGTISVVIPCHNEEMNIEPLVNLLMVFYGDYIYEIILVDDNSRDSTREVIQRLQEKNPLIRPVYRVPPNGVGRAIMDGYKVATGKYILSMDCDFQHLLPELRDIFDAAAEGYDVVIGSRFSRHSVLLNYPFNKILANRAFHFLARLLFSVRFRDLTNNLKMMRREVIEKLELTQPGFAINAETGLMPLLMDFTIKEVPISWINRTADMGVSSFKLLKVGGGYWKVLFRLWIQLVFRSRQYYPKTSLKKIKQSNIAV